MSEVEKVEKPEKDSYGQIIKVTAIFGGVQVYNIFISIIRLKFIAVLLGASGVGLMGLYQNALSLISSVSSLGITSSAVRDIAAGSKRNDQGKIARVVSVFRKWLIFTGIAGTFLTVSLSPFLSYLSFGDFTHFGEFIILSIIIMLGALSAGQKTILKGLRKTKFIALANIYGSGIGLIVTVPIYYWLGQNGIIPALIISSLLTLTFSTFFVRKIKIQKVALTIKETYQEGKEMVRLGIMMTISSLFFTLCTYLVILFINYQGGIEEVGLYQAGLTITTKYVGLVFTAMSLDYYPRLSAVHDDNKLVKPLVNEQSEVALLLLAPILILLISTIPLVIQLLYSSSFLPMIDFVQWLTIGMLIKAMSWTLGFILLAKGNSKLFLYTELFANSILLVLNILFYKYFGLEGLGISFVVGYIAYFIVIYSVCRKVYEFSFSREFIEVLVVVFSVSLVSFISTKVIGYPYAYFTGVIIFAFSLWYTIRILNKRMNLMSIIRSKILKKRK